MRKDLMYMELPQEGLRKASIYNWGAGVKEGEKKEASSRIIDSRILPPHGSQFY